MVSKETLLEELTTTVAKLKELIDEYDSSEAFLKDENLEKYELSVKKRKGIIDELSELLSEEKIQQLSVESDPEFTSLRNYLIELFQRLVDVNKNHNSETLDKRKEISSHLNDIRSVKNILRTYVKKDKGEPIIFNKSG